MRSTIFLAVALWTCRSGALELSVLPQAGSQLRIRVQDAATLAESGQWRWRAWEGSGFGPWQSWTGGHELRLAAERRPLEVEFVVEGESGWQSGRRLLVDDIAPAGSAPAAPARRLGKKRAAGVSGRLLYLDRRFDRNGYVGTRRLPMRLCELELRRASDDSLLAQGSTDAEGYFDVAFELAAPTDVRIDALSRIRQPQLALDVLDLADQPRRLGVAQVADLLPDQLADFGELLQQSSSVESFQILDTGLDAIEFLAEELFAGALPDSGSIPPLRYDPVSSIAQTSYNGSEFLISSTASGDSDAWSDCLILAAMGNWAQSLYGRLQLFAPPDPADPLLDARRAQGSAQAMVFAAMVRQRRATLRLDADGQPADAKVQDFVDLPTAAPPGVPVGAEWWLDLESRQLNGQPLAARGQRSAFNVATLLYDLADGSAMVDDLAADDDAFDETGQRWFASSFSAMQALPPSEAISYEDVHFDWAANYGQLSELLALGVGVGGCVLTNDADEPNDTPASASELELWVQPDLAASGSVRLGEIFLGEVDAVELCNPTQAPIDVSGYRVVTRRNGFGSGSELTSVLPAGSSIEPGRHLVLHEGAGAPASPSDRFDANWDVPWRHDEDGACILQNASGVAIDFVRWAGAGGADPSTTPVPPNTAFAGLLVAPALEPFTLGRDSLAGDSDQASDFAVRAPTPRVPNVSQSVLRKLVPSSDLDLVRLVQSAGLSRLELHAFEPREDARPRIAWLDSLGQTISTAPYQAALHGEGWLAMASLDQADVRARLTQDPGALTSASWQIMAWLPKSDRSLLAVSELRGDCLLLDPVLDTVHWSWSNTGSYDSLRVLLNGALWGVLAGDSESLEMPLPAGRHEFALRPRTAGFSGALASASVFVGPTACAIETGVDDLAEVQAWELVGFEVEVSPQSGGNALMDTEPGSNYPLNDEATALLHDPVDLTSDAQLSFVHHCHLLPDGDLALVELSTDDGGSWELLASYDGSAHVGGGDPADWSDALVDPADWLPEQISLAAFAGQRARLRFRRLSNATGTSLGWGIDDVVIGSHHLGAWIDPTGSDAFGCGHRERPFRSAAMAWNHVAAGDTLHLSAGLHQTASPIQLAGAMSTAILPLPPGAIVVGASAGSTILDGDAAAFGMASTLSASDSATVHAVRVLGGTGLRSDGGTISLDRLDFRQFTRGVDLRGGTLRLDGCVFAIGDTAIVQRGGSLLLQECTFSDGEVAVAAESTAAAIAIQRSIFAYQGTSFLQLAAAGNPLLSLSCNNFFAAPVPFVGLASPVGVEGNEALPVFFCARYGDDYQLPSDSPLLNLPGCGAIGALGSGCSTPTASLPAPERPFRVELRPNPFNPRTEIRLSLPVAGQVEWAIFDARGRSIYRQPPSWQQAGELRWSWDGCDDAGRAVASGVYRLRIRAGHKALQKAMVLLR